MRYIKPPLIEVATTLAIKERIEKYQKLARFWYQFEIISSYEYIEFNFDLMESHSHLKK